MAMLAVLLIGCTAPTQSASTAPSASAAVSSAPPASTAAAKLLVGVAMPTKSLQRWNQDGDNVKKQLEAKGYEVDLQYANNDAATQMNQLEDMITKGCKVLVIASIDSKAIGGALSDAKKANIPVIAYDRLIMDTENVDYYATFDNVAVGEMQGQYIVDKLGLANGKTGPFNMEMFGGSPDDNNAFLFNQGEMNKLKTYMDSGVLKVNSGQTDMSVIAIKAWDTATAQSRMDNLLTGNYSDKNVDVVLSPNDSLAQGICASLAAAGYGSAAKPFPIVTGQDCDVNSVKLIIADKQSMSILKDTRVLATKTVEMVDAILTGKTVTTNGSYNNNVKDVATYKCEIQFADKANYKQILLDSGYYTEDQLK
jgi:putative multiple sugar transport system substrate-binding protein